MAIVSALVCTRNRPESLIRTVRSLLVTDREPLASHGEPLARGGDEFELIVIDQSEGPESEQRLGAVLADPRLHYVRSRVRGKGAALNEGLRLARGEIVVCTDDDCETPPGWPAAMTAILSGQPNTAVLFCNVTAPPCDWDAGYIPTYQRRRDKLLRSLIATCGGHGMGAGMALRRETVRAFGGFDEQIGPGARFPSGDDWDIAHRALLKGWAVYETAQLAVLHHGFRTLAEGRAHTRRDWLAIGAVCAKPIRAGYISAVFLTLWYFSIYALWPPLHDALRLRHPRGRSRISGFISGFVQGLRTQVDPETLLFRPPAGQ